MVIFDMDETLIHCSIGDEGDFIVKIACFDGEYVDAWIRVRPYAR